MAKRKHAAALFEVIHHDKRFPARRPGWSRNAPKWFGGQKSKAGGGAAKSIRSGRSFISTIQSLWGRVLARLPGMPRLRLQPDPERQIVRFQFSYNAAIIAGFTLLVAIGLAYVIGRKAPRHTVPALADQTTDSLKAGPVQADVLDVHGDEAAVAMAVEPSPTSRTPEKMTPTSIAQQSGRVAVPAEPNHAAATGSSRVVNMHYAVVQTYPEEERNMAEEAAKLLNNNGVPCSVEFGLSFAPKWYAVVGFNSFERARNSPEFDAYVAKIVRIGATLGKTSRFKKFDPKAYKWRGSPDAGSAKGVG